VRDKLAKPESNKGIERALSLLKAVAAGNSSGRRLGEIVQAAGLSKSTTHRLLHALVDHGAVEYQPDTSRFFLGYGMFEICLAAGNRFGLLELAKPVLARLVERTEDTVYLSVRDGLEAICLARMEGTFPIKTLTLNVGDRRPLGAGAGSLALLAFQAEAEVPRIVQECFRRPGKYPRLDIDTVTTLVQATRRQGFALNDGLLVQGMSAIGAPVLGAGGTAIAAISVAAISSRMKPQRRANIVAWLDAEARKLEQQLGHARPPRSGERRPAGRGTKRG
jgi:DNA-binding IclR family transcriptional regulator